MGQNNFNPSYVGHRPDILALVPKTATSVLDVGCSVGTLGAEIKARNSAIVYGIELDTKMAKIAESKLDKVVLGDVESLNLSYLFKDMTFDCIILGDILEHLKDPWRALANLTKHLETEGIAIASIPNIRHYTTILNLLLGNWPYRDRGIHDRTHLRFFTLANITEMFQDAGLRIVELRRNYRIIERPHKLNRLAKYLAPWPLREFLTFQYLVKAQKR